MADINTMADLFDFAKEQTDKKKQEIIQKLQEKLNNLHVENSGTEYQYCFRDGQRDMLEQIIELIQNQ